jgi:hypothetical protein
MFHWNGQQETLKMTEFFIVIATGALSFAPGLNTAIETRITQPTAYSLDVDMVDQYNCYVGVPYGYAYLIGQEVWFRDVDAQLHGPWLVVDVEQKKHAGMLADRGLAADVICRGYDMTHQHGKVGIRSTVH